jgi:septin 6/8/11
VCSPLLKTGGHVGFDSLPDQLVNKSIEDGFTFNILSISKTGVGKSTLADSLFNTSFDSAAKSHTEAGVRLKADTYELQESNVNLKLTLVDTVGYGDQINKEDSFGSIVDYIDSQFEVYLQEELGLTFAKWMIEVKKAFFEDYLLQGGNIDSKPR